jgi:hypothetical protein
MEQLKSVYFYTLHMRPAGEIFQIQEGPKTLLLINQIYGFYWIKKGRTK